MEDWTIQLSDYFVSHIENSYKRRESHSTSVENGYYCIISTHFNPHVESFWFWKTTVWDKGEDICEIIDNTWVRIPQRNLAHWSAKVEMIVAQFEQETGRKVTIGKVNHFIQWGDF